MKPFKRKTIKTDDYLRNVVLYIHNNPVKAYLCKRPEDWEFSSYKTIISNIPTLLKREEIIEYFETLENFKFAHQIKDR